MEENNNWQISDLYQRSFKLIKENKLLWVFGAAVAAFSGGSNFNSNFNSSDFNDFQKYFSSPQSQNSEVSKVLGASTESAASFFSQIVSAIPVYYYLIFALEIIGLIILGIGIALVSKAWANGLLINGINTADEKKTLSIADSSQKSLTIIKPLIWVQLVPGLIFAALSVLSFAIITFGITLTPVPAKFFFYLLLVIAIGAFVYWLVFLILSQIWATRGVILNHQNGKEAFFLGFKAAKKKFWPMVLLGLVNNILAIFILAVPIAIVVGIAVALVFAATQNHALIIPMISLGVVLAIALGIGFTLLIGIFTAFKASVWTLAYKKISKGLNE